MVEYATLTRLSPQFESGWPHNCMPCSFVLLDLISFEAECQNFKRLKNYPMILCKINCVGEIGPMVEWFTMPACHAVWYGFESRWDRNRLRIDCKFN